MRRKNEEEYDDFDVMDLNGRFYHRKDRKND